MVCGRVSEAFTGAGADFEITRESLADGLDCDYMTREQLYKMRLATNSVPLYRAQATAEELAVVRVN